MAGEFQAMKKLLGYIHYLIFAWALWSAWTLYEAHVLKMEELEGSLPPIQNNLAKSKRQLASLKKYYKDVEAAKERIDMVAKQVEELQKQFPNEISDTQNLHFFSEMARTLNMRDVYLNPDREDIHGFYVTKEYVLKASGTFLQFLVFLEKLEQEQKLYNIKTIQLDETGKNQKGRYQLINGEIRILAYRYNTGYKEDRGYEQIESELQKMEEEEARAKRKSRPAPAPGSGGGDGE